MSKWNSLYLKLSVMVTVFLPMFIPSSPVYGGIIKYNYGFPFANITIYQTERTSVWFFENFFNGNAGLLINLLISIVNIVVLYYVIWYLVWLFNKIQKKN